MYFRGAISHMQESFALAQLIFKWNLKDALDSFVGRILSAKTASHFSQNALAFKVQQKNAI